MRPFIAPLAIRRLKGAGSLFDNRTPTDLRHSRPGIGRPRKAINRSAHFGGGTRLSGDVRFPPGAGQAEPDVREAPAALERERQKIGSIRAPLAELPRRRARTLEIACPPIPADRIDPID